MFRKTMGRPYTVYDGWILFWFRRTIKNTNNQMFHKARGLPHTMYDGRVARWFRHTVDSPGTHWMHVPPKYGRRAKPPERFPKVSCAWDTLLEDFER